MIFLNSREVLKQEPRTLLHYFQFVVPARGLDKNIWVAKLGDTGPADISGLRIDGARVVRARHPNANPGTDIRATLCRGELCVDMHTAQSLRRRGTLPTVHVSHRETASIRIP